MSENWVRARTSSGYTDYVRQRTSIPVATIEATDFTCGNALGKLDVLQNRISGVELASVWDELPHSQRCIRAAEVGRVVKTLLLLAKLSWNSLNQTLHAGGSLPSPRTTARSWSN